MKVHIERNWATGDWNLFIFEKRGARVWMGKPMVLVMEEIPDYRPGGLMQTEPTMRVTGNCGLAEDIMAALAEALAGQGFKSDKRERELESVLATKDAHLQDMRKLVFQEPKL